MLLNGNPTPAREYLDNIKSSLPVEDRGDARLQRASLCQCTRKVKVARCLFLTAEIKKNVCFTEIRPFRIRRRQFD